MAHTTSCAGGKKEMNVRLITEYPVAYESPDHIVPVGTKNDNNSSSDYIAEVEKFFDGKRIAVMDIGCAGGQLVVDFHERGHCAVGVEGSDYNTKHGLHNWPKYHNSVLFTADITKPFVVVDDNNERVLFDLISAWEVIEHISWNDLDAMFANVLANLKPGGLFLFSINCDPDVRQDANGDLHFLHQSVFPKEFWIENVLNKYRIVEYPFETRVRTMSNYFCLGIRREE